MSPTRSWRRPLAVVLFMCAQYPASVAASDTLTLAQALARIDANSPRLKAAQATVAAATATRDQAAVRTNPEFSLDLENVMGSGPYTGTDSAETTLAISQTFDRSRHVRTAAADAELRLATDEMALQRLEVAADATRRFVGVVAAQERLVLARRAEALAQETRDDLDRRAAAARAPIAERNRARMASERARLAVRSAGQHLVLARRQMSALWGGDEADFAVASGDLFSLPPVAEDAELLAAIANSPATKTLQNSERLREAEVSLQRAQRKLPITANVGLRDFADTGDNAILIGVSVPIPLFDRNQPGIAAAEARLDAQRSAGQGARRDMEVRVLGLVGELRQLREQVQSLRETSLPLAQEALEQTRYGFERGRFSWLELATTQQELIDTENEAIDAAAAYHVQLAELEALTGLARVHPKNESGEKP